MLKGKNVILAPIKKEYIDKFIEWLNDLEITQHLMGYRPLTRDMEEKWYTSLKERENDIIFAILINQTQLIGNCGIMEIMWKDRTGKCGIFIGDKKEQGKAYGTEAMKLLLNYGFNTLNLNRIDLKVNDFNSRAIKCYQKLGFIEEGRMRQSCFRNGEYHDQIIMSILRSEWKEFID